MIDSAGLSGGSPQFTPSGAGPEVLDPGPPDVLPPAQPHDDVPTRKKRGGSNITRINQVKQIRSQELSMQLKELICEHGFSISKAARELGITRRWAKRLWDVWVDRLRRAREGTDEEVQKAVNDVRLYCDHNARAVVERCLALVEVSPAYAAGALRGMELVARLNGINLDAPTADGKPGGGESVESILQAAQNRAGTQLAGLAVDVAVMVDAVDEAASSPAGVGIDKKLRQFGG